MFFACITKKKLITIITLALVGIVSVIALSTTGAHQVFFGGRLKKLPIYSVETSEKKVAISFDCAWGVDYTDKLLEIMEKEQVKCTFFAVEFWSKKHPDYLKKIADAGHEIGTHSSTHPYMSKLNKDAIIKELNSSCQAIESVTNKKVELFRAPYGDYNDLLIDTAKELNLFTIQWDVDSLDWKDLSAKEIENRVVKRVKNGSIVLFHNQGLHTADALPQIIKSLKEKGYTFVPIGQLIYRENYRILHDGTQQSYS
ncbi:MAG: polysaccharide deacetylase family protein [Clostridia bacterium]|nr:polysaccharide deacetylase family protein [Clostridia bacterium]